MTTIAPAVDRSSKGTAASMPATVAMMSISRLRRHDSSSMLWASALTLATALPPQALRRTRVRSSRSNGPGSVNVAVCSPASPLLWCPFEHRGDALADADAHRHQRVAAAGALQLAGRGQCDARAGGAERVADCDRAAIHIDPAVVEGQFEAAQA